jgi:hypothetical protein
MCSNQESNREPPSSIEARLVDILLAVAVAVAVGVAAAVAVAEAVERGFRR